MSYLKTHRSGSCSGRQIPNLSASLKDRRPSLKVVLSVDCLGHFEHLYINSYCLVISGNTSISQTVFTSANQVSPSSGGSPGSPVQSLRAFCSGLGAPGSQPTCWLPTIGVSSSRQQGLKGLLKGLLSGRDARLMVLTWLSEGLERGGFKGCPLLQSVKSLCQWALP